MSDDRTKQALADIVARIPAGRVATWGQIARHLNVTQAQVVAQLAAVADREREGLAWHRVVADGGAVGRHRHRAIQIERLQREGVSVSGAGIVQAMPERAVGDLDNPGPAIAPPGTGSIGLGGRSRGMRDRPGPAGGQ